MEANWVRNGNVILWVETFRNSSNPELLLIIGAGAISCFFLTLFALCWQRMKALPYAIEDLVEDAVAILNDYKIKAATVVGHSMGGTIAQLLLIMYPDRISKLISVSVGPASPNAHIEPIPKETMQALLSNSPLGDLEADKEGWMDSFRLLNGNVI